MLDVRFMHSDKYKSQIALLYLCSRYIAIICEIVTVNLAVSLQLITELRRDVQIIF